MAWFLRAIELPDGDWACRWSQHEFDRHSSLETALDHLHDIAATMGPVELFVHWGDGHVKWWGPVQSDREQPEPAADQG